MGFSCSNCVSPPLDYGLIGNLRTAALVGMDGSIDWLCLPDFDSPSVFAALLDDHKGGRFRIAPPGEGFRRKQHYWPNTNILITRFLHPEGAGEVELSRSKWRSRRRSMRFESSLETRCEWRPRGPPSPPLLVYRGRSLPGERSYPRRAAGRATRPQGSPRPHCYVGPRQAPCALAAGSAGRSSWPAEVPSLLSHRLLGEARP
jgi:hypothetical protein